MPHPLLQRLGLFTGIFLMMLTLPANARNYFVDNRQGVAGDGSYAHPFHSLPDSIDFLLPGDTLFFRGDIDTPRVYRESFNLKGPGGRMGQPLVIRPWRREKVELRSESLQPLIMIKCGGVVVENLRLNQADVKRDALLLLSAHNTVRGCTIFGGRRDGIDIEKGAGGNIIEDNIIYDFNSDTLLHAQKDAHGIVLNAGSDNIIRRNSIFDCNGDCIQIYHGDARRTQIVGNHLYTTLGGGSENAIDIKSCRGVLLADNRMHGFRQSVGSDGAAIVLHHAADSIIIRGNRIYDCNGALRIATSHKGTPTDIVVERNTIHDLVHQMTRPEDGFAFILNGVHTLAIISNTVVNIHGPLFHFGRQGLHGLVVGNNLFVNTGKITGEAHLPRGSVTSAYNGWFSAGGRLAGEQYGTGGDDPLFIDPRGANFRLQSRSTAIDRGDPASAAPPGGGMRIDLGAYEFIDDGPRHQ